MGRKIHAVGAQTPSTWGNVFSKIGLGRHLGGADQPAAPPAYAANNMFFNVANIFLSEGPFLQKQAV